MSDIISLKAVSNFLISRNANLDFFRDTLEVVIGINGNVEVLICDKLSGGSTGYSTNVSPEEFETTYSQ